MIGRPGFMTVVPYLLVPAVLGLVLLLWAKRRGATWAQVQLSFGAGMLGAFMTATGWILAAYLSGQPLSVVKVVGSELLVAAACAMLAFFGTMPHERDLTDELNRRPTRGEE